jgi:hypothetical protein
LGSGFFDKEGVPRVFLGSWGFGLRTVGDWYGDGEGMKKFYIEELRGIEYLVLLL